MKSSAHLLEEREKVATDDVYINPGSDPMIVYWVKLGFLTRQRPGLKGVQDSMKEDVCYVVPQGQYLKNTIEIKGIVCTD